jgi:hypothetical protein
VLPDRFCDPDTTSSAASIMNVFGFAMAFRAFCEQSAAFPLVCDQSVHARRTIAGLAAAPLVIHAGELVFLGHGSPSSYSVSTIKACRFYAEPESC